MMKNKKIKKFHRVIAVIFAMAFAILPFSSFANSRISSVCANAEDFGHNGGYYFDKFDGPLETDNSYLNPYSFFEFSIRRPGGDWSGLYDNSYLNVYNFSLSSFITNTDFLRENGINSTSMTLNDLSLYTGSVRMTFNESYRNWAFDSSSFPAPLTDLIGNGMPDDIISTFRMRIREKLIPYDSFLSILGNGVPDGANVLIDNSNCFRYSFDIVYLDSSNVEPFEVKHFSGTSQTSALSTNYLPIPNGEIWIFHDIYNIMGLTLDTISNYRYSSTVNAFYIKNLDLQFYFNPDLPQADYVYDLDFYFGFRLPNDSSLIDKKGQYFSLLDSYNDIVGQTEYVSVSPINSIFSVVDDFFNLELFPDFKLSYILYIGIAGLVIGFAIKIFLQG